MQRPEKETITETVLAAEGKGVGLELPTARCPSPQWGEGSGGGGLKSWWYDCHFEPKTRSTTVISSRRREILCFHCHRFWEMGEGLERLPASRF